MTSYCDLTILPDAEFNQNLLMNALYNKLHRALVALKTNQIGVSFPQYDQKKSMLGNQLRLHGEINPLQQLMAASWLQGMKDHLAVGPIAALPSSHGYQVVKRVQAKSNADRIRRRAIKRHMITQEEAFERIPNSVEKKLNLPFVVMGSGSTQQKFRLFILQEEVSNPESGGFSSYGLSKSTTVPRF